MDPEVLDLFERSLRNSTTEHTGNALDTALANVGWRDALTMDPRAAISTLFHLQGVNNVSSSALGHVIGHALGLGDRPALGVVLPAVGLWDPPGRMVDGHLQVDGLAPAVLCAHDYAAVVTSSERGDIAVVVPTASLTLTPVRGIDPYSEVLRVSAIDLHPDERVDLADSDWTSGVALARLALGHEIVGASRAMLELARQHALGRIQFGRPISSFQAIRHRLADTLVAIGMAEAILDAAWLDATPGSAAMAKAVAGRAAHTTVRHCQQVLAGIGFTTEHRLHLYVRRTLLLDGLFGTSVALTRALGEETVKAAQLPPLLPL